jgi:hypothetical protein
MQAVKQRYSQLVSITHSERIKLPMNSNKFPMGGKGNINQPQNCGGSNMLPGKIECMLELFSIKQRSKQDTVDENKCQSQKGTEKT